MSCFILQCRFVIKYNHHDGQLQIKATDDTVVSNILFYVILIYVIEQ